MAAAVFWLVMPHGECLAGETGRVTRITCSSLEMMLRFDPNIFLVDVREPDELQGPLGHLDMAHNIPLEVILSGKARLPGAKSLVFICRSGRRSRLAAEYMAGQGISSYWVQGGMIEWRHLNVDDMAPREFRSVPQIPPSREEQGPRETPVHILDQDMGC
jgi:rhodanese-related sulfurtransferase